MTAPTIASPGGTDSPAEPVCRPVAPALPSDRLERVWAWGMTDSAMSYVWRPSTVEGVAQVLRLAGERGVSVGLRGAGRSYGDASLNSEQICLDLSRLNRILDWNPDTGVIRVEPGVTIEQLWHYTIEDGWWPYVVSGTMFPTLGGAAGMNIHGKNNFRVGTIGDHILDFDLMLPSGAIEHCSRTENPDLFHAAIGGFGMLGCFVSLTLEMKRVHSGLMRVEPVSVPNLGEMIRAFEERMGAADYLVGWMDCFAGGARLGRGLIHQATDLAPGEDPAPAQTLRVENQELPDTFMFGLLPKSVMWRFMRPFVAFPRVGMRTVDAAKYYAGMRERPQHQSHAAFAFLLDYVPNWKWAYRPGGLIQYQSFIPAAHAQQVFAEQLTLCHRRGLVPLLGVFKRHRPDPFLMTHAVEGYSLALDFRVTEANRDGLWALAAEMDHIVLQAEGRFYFAKDSTLNRANVREFLEAERVGRFLELKRACDPDSLFQTDLYRRLFTA